MGYLKDKHGMELLGATPPGTCSECAVEHAPEQPHNQQSITYQYTFYDQHGRWPTWADAMAHCPEEVKDVWISELRRRGVDIDHAPDTDRNIGIEISMEVSESGPLENLVEVDEQKCRVCGCAWDHACEDGCYWVEDDLCSKCVGKENKPTSKGREYTDPKFGIIVP